MNVNCSIKRAGSYVISIGKEKRVRFSYIGIAS